MRGTCTASERILMACVSTTRWQLTRTSCLSTTFFPLPLSPDVYFLLRCTIDLRMCTWADTFIVGIWPEMLNPGVSWKNTSLILSICQCSWSFKFNLTPETSTQHLKLQKIINFHRTIFGIKKKDIQHKKLAHLVPDQSSSSPYEVQISVDFFVVLKTNPKDDLNWTHGCKVGWQTMPPLNSDTSCVFHLSIPWV